MRNMFLSRNIQTSNYLHHPHNLHLSTISRNESLQKVFKINLLKSCHHAKMVQISTCYVPDCDLIYLKPINCEGNAISSIETDQYPMSPITTIYDTIINGSKLWVLWIICVAFNSIRIKRFMRSLDNLYCVLLLLIAFVIPSCNATLLWHESTFEITNIASKDSMALGVYNDSVWLLGGNGDNTDLYEININTENVTLHTNDIQFSNSGQMYCQSGPVLFTAHYASAYINGYNMQLQTQTYNITKFNTNNDGSSCITANSGYLFRTGGDGPVNVFYIYNFSTHQWYDGEPMIMSRMLHSCDVVNEQLYVISGISSSGYIDSVLFTDIRDPYNNISWNVFPDTLQVARARSRSVVFEELIFIAGGNDGSNIELSSVEVIDTVHGTISIDSYLIYPKSRLSLALIDRTLFSFGGYPITNNAYYQYAIIPTEAPTNVPTSDPSSPSLDPTNSPTIEPTHPTINPTNNPTIEPTINPSLAPTRLLWQESTFEITSITYKDSMAIGVYNDSVWLFGGVGNGDKTELYEININTENATSHTNNVPYSGAGQNYCQSGAVLFTALYTSAYINGYNMQLQTQTHNILKYNTSNDGSSCITANNGYLFRTGGFYSGNEVNVFYIYNFSTQQWYDGEPMLMSRKLHSCDVVNEQLYVISGDSPSGYIDSVLFTDIRDPYNNVSWNVFPDTLQVARARGRSVVFEELIFIAGGNDGSYTKLSSVEVIDTVHGTIYIDSYLIYPKRRLSLAVIDRTLFSFGGEPTRNNEYYQYAIIPTEAPTDVPTYATLDPSHHPTSGTWDPTNIPTIEPTIDPTNNPTISPTFEPTIDPTQIPTHEPTFNPTNIPTVDPTNNPSSNPTIEPSINPTNNPTQTPTCEPTFIPSNIPTVDPINNPSINHTIEPTMDPSNHATNDSTSYSTIVPTLEPTELTPNNTNNTSINSISSNHPTTSPTNICNDYPFNSISFDGSDIINDLYSNHDVSWFQNQTSSNLLVQKHIITETNSDIICDNDDKHEDICFIGCYESGICANSAVNFAANTKWKEIRLICSSKKACSYLVINATETAINTLSILCVELFACKDLQLRINDISTRNNAHDIYANITCYDDNSCDNMEIITDHSPNIFIDLHVIKYSEDISISHHFFNNINLKCGYDDDYRYIQYDTYDVLDDYELLRLSRSEYTAHKLPCEDIYVFCSNSSDFDRECEYKYTFSNIMFNFVSDTLLDENEETASCYWLDVDDIYNVQCEGTCNEALIYNKHNLTFDLNLIFEDESNTRNETQKGSILISNITVESYEVCEEHFGSMNTTEDTLISTDGIFNYVLTILKSFDDSLIHNMLLEPQTILRKVIKCKYGKRQHIIKIRTNVSIESVEEKKKKIEQLFDSDREFINLSAVLLSKFFGITVTIKRVYSADYKLYKYSSFIIGFVSLFVISLILWCVHYSYRRRKAKKEALTTIVQNPMVLFLGIAEYEDCPSDPQVDGYFRSLRGIDVDSRNVDTLFGEKLNYNVFPKQLKLKWTLNEMMEFLRQKANELESNIGSIYDSLIVILSCHGITDYIVTSDYKTIKKSALHRIFTAERPKNRQIPRMFIFDCCDGHETRRCGSFRGETMIIYDETQHEPSESDVKKETLERVNSNSMGKDVLEKETYAFETGVKKETLKRVYSKNIELSSVSGKEGLWLEDEHNPDFMLVTIHAANEGFQSKVDVVKGSYVITAFVDKMIENIDDENKKWLFQVFDDIQSELHQQGKQHTVNTFNDNMRYLKFVKNNSK